MCWYSVDLGVMRVEATILANATLLFISGDIVDFLPGILNFNNVEVRGIQHFLWMIKQLHEVGDHDIWYDLQKLHNSLLAVTAEKTRRIANNMLQTDKPLSLKNRHIKTPNYNRRFIVRNFSTNH